MSVYKEMGSAVREIENQSTRIYPDAADYGVPVKSKSDPIIKLINGVAAQYGLTAKTHHYGGDHGTGATQVFEFDGGFPAVLEAGFEKAQIIYVTTRDHKDLMGYVYVTTQTSEIAKKKAQSYDY